MPLPTASFLLGMVVIGYLLTFVIFAVLRIVTGVSIQRIGYSGFRHASFSPRPGLRIDVRGLGLSVHRPTFALPTWCSLVVNGLTVTVDLKVLSEKGWQKGARGKANGPSTWSPNPPDQDEEDEEGHGRLWTKLTEAKEKIKRLHSKINYLRMVDLVATQTSVNMVGVGSISLERVTLSVDTRSKTVDRSRLFQHHKTKPDQQLPAEWKCLIRSVLLTPEGKESTELLDYCTFNVHGMLHNHLQGLRDASISLKLGRLNLPYDDIEHARNSADMLRGRYAQAYSQKARGDVALDTALHGLERVGSHEELIVRNVSDSRAFIASILRGIQEVQFAVGFFGLSRKLDVKGHSGKGVYCNLAAKEVSLDVLRLDPKSPAHRMYFSTNDVAHQGLITAIAISAGIDDGQDHPERMVYIPMVTATIKTTLPSRTIRYIKIVDAKERNTNMLYANFVCTSPSVDLDPKHLPLVRDILKKRGGSGKSRSGPSADRHDLIAELLPKAHVKLSIQEPVIRVSLPPMAKKNGEGDFDLLISSMSSMTVDLDSSHAGEEGVRYSLTTRYRHTDHHLYYQTAASERHDLLRSDTIEADVDVNAIPDPSVTANARFRTFAWFLVRPDICEGLRQIVHQLRNNVLTRPEHQKAKKPSFLRTLPPWLEHCRVEGTDFGFELAGVDKQVSGETRGFGVQLESWNAEYRAHREQKFEHNKRRRSVSPGPLDQEKPSQRQASPRRRYESFADGRRLAVHLTNLEGFIIDSVDEHEPESCLSLPRFEVAFSTATDVNGPVFHINSHAKSLLVQYSLYHYYSIGVAAMVVRRVFWEHPEHRKERAEMEAKSRTVCKTSNLNTPAGEHTDDLDEIARHELTTIDFKSNLVQVKARMPHDPPMMLQLYGIDSGHHRWSHPFLRCRMARLYVRAPATPRAWSRIVSLKTLRLDLRDFKRKVGRHVMVEKSIDTVADAIRIAVPHGLFVHDVFDNVINVVKTTAQLQHHFITGTPEYILAKEPEGPKRLPRISVRAQILVFDIEDGSFEWKLGAIYRTGLQEQKQRQAREEAFNLKGKRLARDTRGNSRLRAQSAHPGERSRSRTRASNVGKPRSRSTQAPPKPSPQQSGDDRPSREKMRYDTEGKCGISDSSRLSMDEAREKLDVLSAQSWKARIDRAYEFQTHTVREIRKMLWGVDEIGEDTENQEPILAINQRPGLMIAVISELGLTIDKPSFPVEEYPKFLHDVGKGMPYNMKYSLLVPLNLHVTMGELRFQLRDYPLPLLHVPMLANGQSPRLPALSLKTDFVIAEEFRDIESQRHVKVEIIPKRKVGPGAEKPFTIDVRRTVSPVKTYSDMKIEINTANATRFSWGTSYQPAIQDTMQVIEGFTKPPVDPSDRVGFWDKIRLAFHSRVNVAWKGDGDVHLILKGTRDPYVVTGNGAGLVMVWRNDVRWNIAQDKDPRKFMTVDSGDYILAVPDFNGYARRAYEDMHYGDGTASTASLKRDAVFRKVVMKLSGKVQWLAGLMFERDTTDGKRTFDFKPHYDVVLKNPDFAKAPESLEYDAFRGFRSEHIHMSVAVSAPHDRDWNVSNLRPSNNYNAVHLTPRFFTLFLDWWHMFSGIMSLPIRQGPLWVTPQKKSKKFGRHIATFKYNLLLSPVYIAHVYKHKDAEGYKGGTVSFTGLKMKLDSFMLDVHQRREHFDIKDNEGVVTKKTSAMRINQAHLDFIHADLRALSASIAGTSAEDIDKADQETLAELSTQQMSVDMSKFEIPDNDLDWIDMDDFVELDWTLPSEGDPETKILPLGYAPRFTYFRQTDHGGTIAGDPSRTSPFGDEPTHYCIMSRQNDPRRVQAELIGDRLVTLKAQRAQNERATGEQEVKLARTINTDTATRQKVNDKLEVLRSHSMHLTKKGEFLQSMLDTLIQRMEHDDPSVVPELETSEEFYEAHENARNQDEEFVAMDSAPLADYSSDFTNRFIVHNAQIKWNNSLRNIILRYIHQNSQRRGFVYYMSRRAVKFILDVLEERKKNSFMPSPSRQQSQFTQISALSPDVDDEETIQDRIEQILRDGRNFVNADEPVAERQESRKGGDAGPSDEIAQEFVPLNVYHFRLIAPQVQLQSEKNPKSAVLVTSKGMQLKIVEIMDRENVNDDVSGLVQRRFMAAADSLQMFVTSTRTFSTEFFHMYSANLYGAKAGTQWPPWVPMEIMFDYLSNPYGFNRVVQRTSASLRYDKFNNLRLKYNDDVTGSDANKAPSEADGEERLDHFWVEFPHFRAICDSAQYFAMYIIVMDLLLYNEPLEKTRNERLEKIMLASDFSDLSGAPEMVHMLQERIRQLEDIKLQFQINEKYLDRQGWKDRTSIDQDLASCEDELFFMMKAITTSQQRMEDRREQEDARGMLHLSMAAKEIGWHLIRDKNEPLVEFQLKDASFDRTDNNDGSNYNVMEIGRISGFNLLPNALYPTVIAPFMDESRGGRKLGENEKMLHIHWLMLEAIAGIPVVDYFEVNLVPLRLQVEREVATKLFEYIFPGAGSNAFENSGFSPFMVKNQLPTQEEEDEDNHNEKASGTAGTETPRTSMQSREADHSTSGNMSSNSPVSLDQRLAPTLHLPQRNAPKLENKERGLGISNISPNLHGFHIFQQSDRSRQNLQRSAASRQASSTANSTSNMSRSPSTRSLSTLASQAPSTADTEKTGSKRTLLHRSYSDERKKKNDKRSDDLTQMLNRASNYMTLAFVKIPSMVLCLSYKGQGKRNIEDVHDLVFRMPTLEYRNKTWSNLDLAMQLKKDVIKALISHAGAIVTNKLSHHRPSKQQQSRLREIANSSTFIVNGNGSSNGSETSSVLDLTETPGRPSTASARPSTLNRSLSFGSTPASSNADIRPEDDEQRTAELLAAHDHSDSRRPSSARPSSQAGIDPEVSSAIHKLSSTVLSSTQGSNARSRTGSITRHISGFSERLRQRNGQETMSGDDTEENKRKSKLLLGGQKLLKSLRD